MTTRPRFFAGTEMLRSVALVLAVTGLFFASPRLLGQEEKPSKAAQDSFQKGVDSFQKGINAQALANFSKAIQFSPKFAKAYSDRACVYEAMGNLDAAIADYNRAIELSPRLEQAYFNRGNAYFQKNDYDAAIADFNLVLILNPNNADAYNNGALAYDRSGDYDTAILDYGRALDIRPGFGWPPPATSVIARNGRTANPRGSSTTRAANFKGDHDSAITAFTEAIRLDPQSMHYYCSRAFAYADKKENDKAIADFSRSIEIDPKFELGYLYRGNTYRLKRDFDRALADSTKAIRLQPDDASAYTHRGLVYFDRGDYDKALADFNQAIDPDPKVVAALNIDESERDPGNYGFAIIDPNAKDPHYYRGLAYFNKGDQ